MVVPAQNKYVSVAYPGYNGSQEDIKQTSAQGVLRTMALAQPVRGGGLLPCLLLISGPVSTSPGFKAKQLLLGQVRARSPCNFITATDFSADKDIGPRTQCQYLLG